MAIPLRSPNRLRKPVLIMMAVLALGLVSLIAINRLDQDIDPGTKAWLLYPPLAAPSDKNGYLALLALDAQAANPLTAATDLARAQHTAFTSDAAPRYEETRNHLLQPRHDAAAISLGCKEDCYAYFQSHAGLLKKLSAERSGQLQRYRAMLDFPAYVEDIPADPRMPAPDHALARKLGLLHLGNAALALEQGDPLKAYMEWARHQRFWQTAATGSRRLQSMIAAAEQIALGQSLLSEMLKAHPESLATARLQALPVLQAREKLADNFARSRAHEFQVQSYALTHLIYRYSLFAEDDAQSAGWSDRLALLFYQRNASLNLLYRLHQYDMKQHGTPAGEKIQAGESSPCAVPAWRMFVNPVGKRLLCRESAYDYSHYYQRVGRLDAQRDDLAHQLKRAI